MGRSLARGQSCCAAGVHEEHSAVYLHNSYFGKYEVCSAAHAVEILVLRLETCALAM